MTLSIPGDLPLTPAITLNTEDFRLLIKLAHAGINEASTVADDLLVELDRASVGFDSDNSVAELDKVLLPQVEQALTDLLGFRFGRINDSDKI